MSTLIHAALFATFALWFIFMVILIELVPVLKRIAKAIEDISAKMGKGVGQDEQNG